MHIDPRLTIIIGDADPQPYTWDLPRLIAVPPTAEEMATLRRLAEYDAETDPDPEAWQPWSQSAEEQRGDIWDAA